MTFVAVASAITAADELLPAARKALDQQITRIDQASDISCGPACSDCCVRPVPVTSAELRALLSHIDSLPAIEREAVGKRIGTAAAQLQTAGFDHDSLMGLDGIERARFARSYFEAAVPCPLLTDDGSCGMHAVRPLACREYVVTSDPIHCRDFADEAVVRIRPRQDIVSGFAAVSQALGEDSRWLLAPALARSAPPAAPSTPRSGPAMAQILTGQRLPEPVAYRDPTPEERHAVEAASSFPMHAIIDRYRRDLGVDKQTADRNARELLRFLVLGATAESSRSYPMFGPADGIDGLWHTFLLFTRDYADLCERLGRFLHHDPTDPDAADQSDPDPSGPDDYEEFLRRYLIVFGEPAPTDFWPPRAAWQGPSVDST